MSPKARAKMIATPCDAMPAWLIREYTHSTHDIPGDLADLRALLPRYMELLASGEPVDDFRAVSELRRFGAAIAGHPDFESPEQQAAYELWAMALLRAWPVAADPDASEADLLYPLVLLLAGGIRAEAILTGVEDLFDEPATVGAFSEALLRSFGGVDLLDLPPLRAAPEAQRTALLNWLKATSLRNMLEISATDPDLPRAQSEAARIVSARLERVALRA